MQTNSEKFLDYIRKIHCCTDEALKRVEEEMERYDKPYFDALTEPTVIDITPYGFNHMISASRYANDPWRGKKNCSFQEPDSVFITFMDGEFMQMEREDVSQFLYDAAKEIGKPEIRQLNSSISGFIVSYDDLVGSIPEYMREVLENQYIDGKKGMDEVWAWYQREVMTILGYLSCNVRNVQVKDDEGNEKWVTVSVTAVSVGFSRFEAREPGASQTVAFFSVSDMSPQFKPEVAWNWHLQETSRWLYAGAIALNYYKDEKTGEETVTISSHH